MTGNTNGNWTLMSQNMSLLGFALLIHLWHFKWTFTIVQVSQPLLGANFLKAHSHLIDIKGQRLIDSFDLISINLRSIYTAVPHLGSFVSEDDNFAKLLAADYPDFTTPTFTNLSQARSIAFISTNGPPLHAHTCQLPLDKLCLAKEEFGK